jgi:DNA-binding NarL/FixJ family response regulator
VSEENIVKSAKSSIRLSARESAILEKLVDGGTNKDIANQLGICEATVKVHLRACFRKIGAKNRTQAAMWAAQQL